MKKLRTRLICVFLAWLVCFNVLIAFAPLAQAVNFYVGRPYIAGPLGEGEQGKYDKNPLFREDGFDCTTYVESVLAQYRSETEQSDFMENLLRIRYVDGKIGYFTRAHIMEAEWIPNAIKYKYIEEYPLHNSLKSELVFPVREWFLQQKQITPKDAAYLQSAREFPQYFHVSIPFVSRANITAEFLKTLPDFMVVFFLRKPVTDAGEFVKHYKTAHAAQVTHMGLLKNGILYHASSVQKKVVAMSLLDYVREKEKCIGVSFYVVR